MTWVRRTGAVSAAIIAAALALTGCAEPPPQPPQTEEADPAVVSEAAKTLADAPEPRKGWRSGVVVTEDRREHVGLFWRDWVWTISVLDKSGKVVVLTDDYCESDAPLASEVLPVMITPGDLITWTGGSDLCVNEIRIMRKAGA